jgi:peptide/nickel transport system substrate-binding protein
MLGLVVAACVSGGEAAAKGRSDLGRSVVAAKAANATLTFGLASAPESLNPAKADWTDYSSEIYYLWNEPLMTLTKEGRLAPGLATSVRVTNKSRTFTYTLRKNARFSDGEPVTASAVKGWLLYFAHTGGPQSTLIPFRSIETPNKWTVRLNTTSSWPIVPFLLAAQQWAFVAAPYAVAHPSLLAKQTYGAGPYTLVPSQTLIGDHYTFMPNKFYYDKSKIRFSKIVVKVIPTPSSMLQALKTGAINLAQGDPTTADDASRTQGITVRYAPLGEIRLTFYDRRTSNPASAPLADARVRQALNYAVDRRTLAKAFIGAYGMPTSEITSLDGWDPKYQNYYSYDPAKAKQLLAAAGYANGFTLNLVDGSFDGTLGDPLMQAVAQYFAAVGVKVNVTTEPTVAEMLAKGTSQEAEGWLTNWGANSTFQEWRNQARAGGTWNPFGAPDAVLNALATQGADAPPSKAGQYWKAVIDRTVTQADFLPLFTVPTLYYASNKIGGLALSRWANFMPVLAPLFPK